VAGCLVHLTVDVMFVVAEKTTGKYSQFITTHMVFVSSQLVNCLCLHVFIWLLVLVHS